MSFSVSRNQAIKIIILIWCLLFITPNQALSIGFKDIGNIWIKLTTPISSFYYDFKPVVHGMTSIQNKKSSNNIGTSLGLVGGIHLFDIVANNDTFISSSHSNFLIKFATFGNEESLINLNLAYTGGRFYLPYSVFTYDLYGDNSHYWARHSDACSVILYGYSWLINIPAKILNEIDALLILKKEYNYQTINDLPTHKISCFVDIIFNICSLIIEIPLAFANTVIGSTIAFIAHPINSICSFFGLIYFSIISSIVALWDIITNIILIPYHLLF